MRAKECPTVHTCNSTKYGTGCVMYNSPAAVVDFPYMVLLHSASKQFSVGPPLGLRPLWVPADTCTYIEYKISSLTVNKYIF